MCIDNNAATVKINVSLPNRGTFGNAAMCVGRTCDDTYTDREQSPCNLFESGHNYSYT
jgi:hypothetical protein